MFGVQNLKLKTVQPLSWHNYSLWQQVEFTLFLQEFLRYGSIPMQGIHLKQNFSAYLSNNFPKVIVLNSHVVGFSSLTIHSPYQCFIAFYDREMWEYYKIETDKMVPCQSSLYNHQETENLIFFSIICI